MYVVGVWQLVGVVDPTWTVATPLDPSPMVTCTRNETGYLSEGLEGAEEVGVAAEATITGEGAGIAAEEMRSKTRRFLLG